MKRSQSDTLAAQLNRIKRDLDPFSRPDARAAFLRNLDEVIASLEALRSELCNPELEARLSSLEKPFAEVINFFQFAKNDETLGTLLAQALQARSAKPKRLPIHIPPNLKNDQIRDLLSQNLSKSELKAIAVQRGISVGKSSDDDVKRNILRALDRQEGYERLASPGA